MSHPTFKNYQCPATIDLFDVGISYKSDCDEDRLCLNNNLIELTEIELPLDYHGKCMYKIYFKNNTPRLCEVKIFISTRPDDKSQEHSNHLILKPDKAYYIERPDKVSRKYTFVAEESKIFNEIVGSSEKDVNSYVTVIVYPESRVMQQSLHQRPRGLKVETDGFKIERGYGYHSTKEYIAAASAEAPSFSSISNCYGTGLADPVKSGAYSNYNSSIGERAQTVGGVTVLGEKSTQLFYEVPEIAKEGSAFIYKFKLSGLASPEFIPLTPILF